LPVGAVGRLLIGLIAARPLEEQSAARAVSRFEPLMGGLVESWISDEAPKEATVTPLDPLDEEHHFGAALESILLCASENMLLRYSRSGKFFEYDMGLVEITFFSPLSAARIVHIKGRHVRKIWAYGVNVDRDRYLSAVHSSGLPGPAREVRIDQTELNILGKSMATNSFDPDRPSWPVK
jgi:hypothetical protein